MDAKHLAYGGLISAIAILIFVIGYVIYSNYQNNNIQESSGNFLHVEGNKVIDENNNEIFLRGFAIDPFGYRSFKETPGKYSQEQINQFNSDIFQSYLSEEDIKEMRDMGSNVVRKQISFYALEIEPYKYNDGVLEVIDDLINRSYKHGVYVIISLTNAAQNTKQQDNLATYNGTPYLWTDPEWRKRVIAAAGHMAEHFADNPGIAGYDMINEPEPSSKEALHSFYSDIIKEIRKYDKNHIIILENCHFSPECEKILFGGEYEDSNIMLSPHYYNDAAEGVKSNPNSVEYETRQEIEKKVKELLSQPATQGRPIFMGEFSALWGSGEKGLQWTQDVIDLMNQYGMHWTYFSYKNIDNQRGLYVAKEWWRKDLTENQIENLIVGDTQKKLLSTKENYEINQRIKQILEDGFKN